MMIKVAVSGLYFPVTMMEYFIRALERRNDVELFLVGPYFGSYIPWGGGMYLSDKYVRQVNVPLPTAFAQQFLPFKMIESQCPNDIDLWLQIDAGWRFSDRPKADVTAHILTDPHVLRGQYDRVAGVNDFTFCMQSNFMRDGEHYLPYAYDPTIHFPENFEKEYDVCLVGLLYENRKQIIDRLRENGRTVFYNIGDVFDEYRIRYSKTRVALNYSSNHDLPARVWEYAAMNIPFVSNKDIPDQDTFFVPEQHYSQFSNVNDGVNKIQWMLDNYDVALDMSNCAYRKVIANNFNTWDSRISQILETLRVI